MWFLWGNVSKYSKWTGGWLHWINVSERYDRELSHLDHLQKLFWKKGLFPLWPGRHEHANKTKQRFLEEMVSASKWTSNQSKSLAVSSLLQPAVWTVAITWRTGHFNLIWWWNNRNNYSHWQSELVYSFVVAVITHVTFCYSCTVHRLFLSCSIWVSEHEVC